MSGTYGGTFRYRYGETQPIRQAFKAGVAVDFGDCVYEDAADSFTIKPAGSLTWGTAVATATAPTVTDGAVALGTGLTNAATGVKVSYQFPWGEGALSAAGSATPTANAAIKLAAVALPANVIGLNVYVETAAGSGVYQLWGTTQGGLTLITGYGIGHVPAVAPVTSGALDVSQYTFCLSFVGVSGQRYDGTNATAYGIKDGKVRVDTDGVFDFACASASFNPGDLVGLAKQTGSLLDPQTVILVAHRTLAIGIVMAPTTSSTTARVQLFSRKMNANLN